MTITRTIKPDNITTERTRNGYIITIQEGGRSWYISNIYKGNIKVYGDYARAKGYTLETARKHVKALSELNQLNCYY